MLECKFYRLMVLNLRSRGFKLDRREVHKIDKKNIKLPHIGWNNILLLKRII